MVFATQPHDIEGSGVILVVSIDSFCTTDGAGEPLQPTIACRAPNELVSAVLLRIAPYVPSLETSPPFLALRSLLADTIFGAGTVSALVAMSAGDIRAPAKALQGEHPSALVAGLHDQKGI